MHGDWCPSALAVSVTPVELGKEAAHDSQSIFCYSGSYSEQCPSRMCGHCTLNLLVLRSPQFSFTFGPRSSWGHKPVLGICVSHLRVRGQQHHLSEKIGPAIAGSATPALPALSERNECVKET